jgi:hypothetical protein
MSFPSRLFSRLRSPFWRLPQIINYPRAIFAPLGALLRRSRPLAAWFKSSNVWDWLLAPRAARDTVFCQVRLNVETLEIRQMPSGLSVAPIAALGPALAASARSSGASSEFPAFEPSRPQIEPNTGQAPASFDYVFRGANYTADLSPTSEVITIGASTTSAGDAIVPPEPQSIGMNLVGANNNAGAAPDKHSGVDYVAVYDGIDLVYRTSSTGDLDYTFVVKPGGASPGQIAMSFTGVESIAFDSSGNLLLTTPTGDLTEKAPFLYQIDKNGDVVEVVGRFEIRPNWTVSFAANSYDTARTLYIDPTLEASPPEPILVPENVPFTATVAQFHDEDEYATGYTASIDWGDGGGLTAATAISYDPTQLYYGVGNPSAGLGLVTGTNTYEDEGNYSVNVTVYDPDASSALATFLVYVWHPEITSTDTVDANEGELLTIGFASGALLGISGNFGPLFQHPTYTIIDGELPPGVSLTVDPTSHASEITGEPASGTSIGNWTVTLQAEDDTGAIATQVFTLIVKDAPLDGEPATISVQEGTPFTGTVASFQDEDLLATAGFDYTASIDWGDGTTATAGTVTYDQGSPLGEVEGTGLVSGMHTYEDEGNYDVTVTIYDPDGSMVSVSYTAYVSDAPLGPVSLIATADPLSASVGETATLVAYGTDIDADVTVTHGDLSVTVDWGDGTTSSAEVTVTADPDNLSVPAAFTISADHEYDTPGAYLVTVLISDTVSGLSKVTRSTALIDDGEMTVTGTSSLEITLGTSSLDGPVAAFTDDDSEVEASDFATPIIDWGDGSPLATGTVEDNGDDGFKVVASEPPPYKVPGTYLVRTQIQDYALGVFETYTTIVVDPAITGTLDLTVADPVLQTGSTYVWEGDDTLATFQGSPDQTASGFNAMVNWGDGSGWQSATVEAGDEPGSFSVVMDNYDVEHYGYDYEYAAYGDYPVLVEVQDGTRSELRGTTAALQPEDATIGMYQLAMPTNQDLNSIILGTVEIGSALPWQDYTVDIYWGDDGNDPTTGKLVQMGGEGNALIVGNYEYDDGSSDAQRTDGNLSALVVITGPDGIGLTATTPVTTSEWMEGAAVPGDLPLLSFKDERLDVDPDSEDGAFSATIDWTDELSHYLTGDGSVDALEPMNYYEATADGATATLGVKNFGVGDETIGINVAESDPTISVSSVGGNPTFLVVDQPLSEDLAPDLNGTAGVDLAGDSEVGITVATFTDPDPAAGSGITAGVADDTYYAEINWGDGHTTEFATVVVLTTGVFAVMGDNMCRAKLWSHLLPN